MVIGRGGTGVLGLVFVGFPGMFAGDNEHYRKIN